MPNIAYDSNVAVSYDADREGEEHWIRENNFVEEYFRNKGVITVLDLPVGTGRFIGYYPPDAEIIGVDISEHMIDQARKKVSADSNQRILLSVGDGESLGAIASGSVDLIVCFRLMHLVPRNKRLGILREFSRILKGELLLQVYLSPPSKPLMIRLAYKLKALAGVLTQTNRSKKTPWSHIKSYPICENELVELCSQASLKVMARHFLCSYERSNVVVFQICKP